MKVLITGGYGFIGSYVAERFFKEDYEIIIIDNLSGGQKSNVAIPHTTYILNTNDAHCAEVFRIHNIDIVIHAAYTNPATTNHRQASIDNIVGLINILSLAGQYKVKKFLLLSDTQVYGEQPGIITENTIPMPNNPLGINKLIEETYCLNWQRLYQLPVLILRMSTIYGPRQTKASLPEALQKILAGNPPALTEKSESDYLYITDAAEAIYKAAIAMLPESIVNISYGKTIKPTTVATLLNSFSQSNSVINSCEEFAQNIISNSLCCTRLNWQPRYNFAAGLKVTYEWYCKLPQKVSSPESSNVWPKFKQNIFPYLENLALFAVVVSITLFFGDKTTVNRDVGLDYSFVYITIMGLLYGKSQSLLATALATGLLFYSRITGGADFVALIYQTKPMFHLAIYLLIGVLTGYITDNYQFRLENMKITVDNLSTRYQFLENLYLETIKIKDKLYNQLINSSDSIGRLYSIIQKLDSIETEYIYTAATQVTTEIMDVPAVAIYTLGKNKYYLRQKIKTPQTPDHLAKSLKIEDHPYLTAIMHKHKIFVNKDLVPDLPDMAAPVVCNDQVIAVLQIYNLPFEKMDLHHETLFKVTTKLIADALGRAYEFEKNMQDKKYLPHTRILLPEEFAKILKEVDKRSLLQKDFTLFAVIKDDDTDLKFISDTLDTIIREEDFLGLTAHDDLQILLTGIAKEFVPKVQARIEKAGIKISLLDGV